MATHSTILAWESLWTDEPGGLQSIGSQRLGHDLVTKQLYIYIYKSIYIYTVSLYIYMCVYIYIYKHINYHHPLDHQKSKRFPEEYLLLLY